MYIRTISLIENAIIKKMEKLRKYFILNVFFFFLKVYKLLRIKLFIKPAKKPIAYEIA